MLTWPQMSGQRQASPEGKERLHSKHPKSLVDTHIPWVDYAACAVILSGQSRIRLQVLEGSSASLFVRSGTSSFEGGDAIFQGID